MNKSFIFAITATALALLPLSVFSQRQSALTDEIAAKLAQLPLHCITQQYPNKTAHVINNESEADMTPKDLHPSFYGCFDWHSSVHGHWMLVRLLKTKPHVANSETIIATLDNSFEPSKLRAEADYFTKYENSKDFERTYGWAWLLKLDEELATWDNPHATTWHENLQPLTRQIVKSWKNYLPKQTYPNRTGVHPNSAFALGFAIDWARAVNDAAFERELIEKAKSFYLNDKNTPAYLEPDGSDFFSPSLQIADLMCRVLQPAAFEQWLNAFYDKRSIDNISLAPEVSDITDYYIVHLIGLSFSKAWCMKHIAKALPESHPLKKHFNETAEKLLHNALPFVFEGNYGGDHWLASFALMALNK